MTPYTGLLNALGWSLLDSIWQMAVLWTVYYLLTAGNKRFSAAGKYNLGLLFVVFSAEWFVYTFIHFLREPAVPFISGFSSVSFAAGQCIPYLSGLYLIIILVRLVQYGIRRTAGRSGKLLAPVSPYFQSFTGRYTRILGITKQVMVYQTENSETAETSGFLNPLILLPVSLVTQLSVVQVEAILLHELYHIRRNDYLAHILMTCFRSIFFFNPFAHLFQKALERERELACDDGVLELGYEPRVYAEALFSLEKYRQVNPGFSLAADGNKPWLLMERIRRVLGEPAQKEKRFSPLLFSGLAAAFVFFGLQLTAIPDGLSGPSILREVIVPVHYEIVEEKNLSPVTEITSHSTALIRTLPQTKQHRSGERKPEKKLQTVSISPVSSSAKPDETTEAYFADDNAVRNFSNESTAGPVVEPVPVLQGSPYVPSASLSYELQSASAAEDSIRQHLNEICIQDLTTSARLNAVIRLNKLQTEMENNKRQLIEIELKNKRLILLDQQNTKPVLKKLHQEIKIKKRELEGIRNQLRISTEEIIHI